MGVPIQRIQKMLFAGVILLSIGCSESKSADNDTESATGNVNDSDSTVNVGETSANGTVLTQENSDLCDRTCDRLLTCDAEEFTNCAAECRNMALMLNQTVFTGLGDCVASRSCTDLDMDVCMTQGLQNVPDSTVDPLFETMCNKMSTCMAGVDVPGCVSELQSDEEMTMFRILNQNALSCFGECLTGSTCAELDSEGDGVFEDCLVACDADFGGDDDGDGDGEACGDIAGLWTMASVSCSGSAISLENVNLTQTISADCHMEITVDANGCTMSHSGDYSRTPGGSTLAVTSTCGETCGDDCTPQTGGPVGFDVSLDSGSGNLVMTYNVTEDVITANMSACAPGSLNISVFSQTTANPSD